MINSPTKLPSNLKRTTFIPCSNTNTPFTLEYVSLIQNIIEEKKEEEKTREETWKKKLINLYNNPDNYGQPIQNISTKTPCEIVDILLPALIDIKHISSLSHLQCRIKLLQHDKEKPLYYQNGSAIYGWSLDCVNLISHKIGFSSKYCKKSNKEVIPSIEDQELFELILQEILRRKDTLGNKLSYLIEKLKYFFKNVS